MYFHFLDRFLLSICLFSQVGSRHGIHVWREISCDRLHVLCLQLARLRIVFLLTPKKRRVMISTHWASCDSCFVCGVYSFCLSIYVIVTAYICLPCVSSMYFALSDSSACPYRLFPHICSVLLFRAAWYICIIESRSIFRAFPPVSIGTMSGVIF